MAKSSGIVAGSLLASRVLGMLRDTVQSARFGVGMDTDAYNVAFMIPDLLFMLIAGGGLSSAFIPVFSEYLHTEREGKAWNLFSVVVTFCSLVVIVLIGTAWLFAYQLANLMGHGKPPQEIDRIAQMGRILLPAQFAFLIGSLLIATLYSRNRFAIPGLAPNIYNLGIILGALLGPALGYGIESMAWGGLLGAFLGNLVFPAGAMFQIGSHYKPSLDLKTEGVGKFFALLGPVVLGFSLPSVAQIISQYFASPLGEGGNSSIKLANNLMQAPSGIFGQSLALAAFPVLSQFFAQGKMDQYAAQVSKTMRTVIFLAVPASIFLGILAPDVVTLIYGYGKASRPEVLAATVNILRVYSVGILFWCLQPVLMRGFFSVQRTMQPIALSTAMTALFIAMLQLSNIGVLAIPGVDKLTFIPWASNVAVLLLVVILATALHKSVHKIDLSGIWTTFGRSLTAGAFMAVLYAASLAVLPSTHIKLLLALKVLALFLTGSSLYIFIAGKLDMPERAYLDRGLARFRRKKEEGTA